MLLENNLNNIGMDIIDFHLRGVDGKFHSLSDYKSYEIIVLIFMCNHCPYVKAVMKRLTGLQEHFESNNVRFIGINSNDVKSYPEDSFENMKIFFNDYQMNFPYLFDETQETAGNYDAVCTPDIFVFNSAGKLMYRGRLDDNWQDESKVTKYDLKNAIENILSGKEPDETQFPSMGCSIKWKNK
jgi:peroxiredoxin